MEQSEVPKPRPTETASTLDSTFKMQVTRLYKLTVYARWLLVAVLWLTIGSLSLWGLRYPISLLQQHFTWAAVRYGLYFNRLSAIGLGLCVGMTTAILVWQSRNILFGLSQQEQHRLEQQLQRIRHQGSTHPLWKWVANGDQ